MKVRARTKVRRVKKVYSAVSKSAGELTTRPKLGLGMGGSRKKFRGGQSSIVGIKVAQFNVCLNYS